MGPPRSRATLSRRLGNRGKLGEEEATKLQGDDATRQQSVASMLVGYTIDQLGAPFVLARLTSMVPEDPAKDDPTILAVRREETIQEVRTKFAASHGGKVVDFWRRQYKAHQLTKEGSSWLGVRPEENVRKHLKQGDTQLDLEWVEPPPPPDTYTIALYTRASIEYALMLVLPTSNPTQMGPTFKDWLRENCPLKRHYPKTVRTLNNGLSVTNDPVNCDELVNECNILIQFHKRWRIF